MQQLLWNGAIVGCGFGLVAVSFSLIYRLTHFFHFSHGAIFTLGAYIAFGVSFASRPVVAVLIVVLACGLLGVLMEVIFYRPLRARRASSVVMLIVSLGLLVAMQNIVAMLFGDEVRLLRPFSGEQGFAIGSARITSVQAIIIIVSLLLCILLAFTLRVTPLGRIMRAVECDEELAQIVGVDVSRAILYSFAVGSLLAGLAGLLAAADSGLRPTMGFNALLMGVIAMIVGGSQGVLSTFVGGLGIGVAQQFIGRIIDTKWQDALVFFILMVFLVIRPKGIKQSLGRGTG